MSEIKRQKLDLDALENVSGGDEKPKEWITYHVVDGDTLLKIAQRYMCTVSEIKRWNDLKDNNIGPWMILNIFTINY